MIRLAFVKSLAVAPIVIKDYDYTATMVDARVRRAIAAIRERAHRSRDKAVQVELFAAANLVQAELEGSVRR